MSGFSVSDLIEIISCVFTVFALVFTLYFWLMDHLSDDRAEYVKEKPAVLALLNDAIHSLDRIAGTKDLDTFLDVLHRVNHQLEIILDYRFWGSVRKRRDYHMIHTFMQDSRYLDSTIRRAREPYDSRTALAIPELSPAEFESIMRDYQKGLYYILDFVENER